MSRPYEEMTADEKSKFQFLIASYRAARAAQWAAVKAWRLFNSELHGVETLGGELAAPAEPIPYDVLRQGPKSVYASDPSWNALCNEHAYADAFLANEEVTVLALNKAAIGADVAY